MDHPSVNELLVVEIGQAMAGFKEQLNHVAALERLKRKELLTPEEVKQLYGFKVATLETWRCRGGGPDYVKVGTSVYYAHEGIKRFISERQVLGHA